MPLEYRIHLTPDEAASGTTRTIDLPSGTMTIRVPPALSGRLFKIPTAQGDIRVRVEIQVDAGSVSDQAEPTEPVPPAPVPARRRPSVVRLAVPLLVGAVGITSVAVREANSHHNGPVIGIHIVPTMPYDDDPALDDTPPDDLYTDYPLPSDLASQPPDPLGTDDAGLFTTTAPASTPYTTGTCFAGETPLSFTTPILLMDTTDCLRSSNVYKVVQVLMGTTNPDACSSNNGLIYTFTGKGTYSDGTAWQALYCLTFDPTSQPTS